MRNSFIIFLLFLFKISPAQFDLDNQLNVAREKIMAENYEEAMPVLNRIVSSRPENFEGWYLRAIAKYNQKDLPGSLFDFNETIKLKPNFPHALHYRAIVKSQLMNLGGSIEDYTAAIKLDPANGNYYAGRAYTRILAKNYWLAVQDCDSALILSPKLEDAYFFRGIARSRSFNYSEAIKDYTKAININRFNPDYYFQRALSEMELFHYEKALGDLEEALKLDSTSTIIYYLRGIVYSEMDKEKSALDDFSRVLHLDPFNVYALFARATIYLNRDQIEIAKNDLDQILQNEENHLMSIFYRGNIALDENDFDLAKQLFEKAINLYPDFAEAHHNLGMVYHNLGNDVAAEKSLSLSKILAEKRYGLTQAGQFAEKEKIEMLNKFLSDFKNTRQKITSTREINPFSFILPIPQGEIEETAHFSIEIKNYNNQNKNEPVSLVLGEQFIDLTGEVELPTQKNQMIIGLEAAVNKQFDKAIEYFDLALKDDPDNWLLLFSKGSYLGFMYIVDNGLSVSGKGNDITGVTEIPSEEIIDLLNRVIEQKPSFSYAYYNRALVFSSLGKHYEAISDYRKATEKNPNFKEAFYNLGLTELFLENQNAGCSALSNAGALGVKSAYPLIEAFCKKSEE